ncbi:tRNA pseudouridine(55) synthase TruB [Leptotrichia sp. OH3620_COT-345]|uniref:tRNA pseudouridine(55) synthase TruB n=1 Tax=Leptotrichia sp. OH3620_COT-345 TaxID=2491048 RepID=UPI000F645E10|nr:tRNA pseudouridine(55) synthase TruB [Leptotrichia sp. OH3620_COT-345]RRD38954.1 tRNA pseudouridine(55) synthase TruB [Leptotrichia sp. OH3620_COT-345]
MKKNNKFLTDGIILLNKEKGISSFGAVNRLKKLLNADKSGHAGTLDPMAEGLLIIMLNRATKFSDSLMKKDKEYYIEMELGYQTDTYDTEGMIIHKYEEEIEISNEKIIEVIKSFLGSIEQFPPMYSAIKMGGKKLYELARKGIEVERKPRKVKINSIKKIKIERGKSFKIFFYADVSSGTYIRTLVKDIGDRLGVYATMTKLVRTRIGNFALEEAVSMKNIEKINESLTVLEIENITKLKNVECIFDYDKMTVNEEKYRKLKNGMTVLFKTNKFKEIDKLNENTKYKVYMENKMTGQKEFKGVAGIVKKGLNSVYIKREKYFL